MSARAVESSRRARVVFIAAGALALGACGDEEMASPPGAGAIPAATASASPSDPTPGASSTAKEREAAATAAGQYALSADDECPITEKQASDITGSTMHSIPTPGSICGFGGDADLSTEPSLSIAVISNHLVPEDSMSGVTPHPRWGTGALFLDEGCELACTGTAYIPIGDKTLSVRSDSGANGSKRQTERQIDEVLELLESSARSRR